MTCSHCHLDLTAMGFSLADHHDGDHWLCSPCDCDPGDEDTPHLCVNCGEMGAMWHEDLRRWIHPTCVAEFRWQTQPLEEGFVW